MADEKSYDLETGIVEMEESMIDRNLEGPIENAIAYLQRFVGPDRQNVRIERYQGYDDDWLVIRWERKLNPEEIAKRERDEREYEACIAAERADKERREYERLKAKFGA